MTEEQVKAIRAHQRPGRPLGDEEFQRKLEKQLGRVLRCPKGGAEKTERQILMYGISFENTIVGAILVTIAWFFFMTNGHQYLSDSPPRANVIPSKKMEINGQTVEVPMLDAVDIHKGNGSGRFMTQRAFDRELEEYRREHKWRGILAALGAVVTFFIGARLGEHWACGLACVLFGPLAVAYTGYRRTRFT